MEENMTNYQTTIQKPGAIRWGSAKIELKAESGEYINLGAIKGITASTETTGIQTYSPDNTPPVKTDPTPTAWNWSFSLEEAWNPDVLKLMRGDVDTYTTSEGSTVIGVYAGTGKRPSLTVRLTNTTAGQQPVIIELESAKITSELDWTFPSDNAGDTALALPVTLSADITPEKGFGTITIPTVAE